MIKYSCGFAFSEDHGKVALIRKARPEWQAGKLNGIGGHIEIDETPIQAMIREFEEETGRKTNTEDWTWFCYLRVRDCAVVYMFKSMMTIESLGTTTDEIVEIFDLTTSMDDLVPNLKWLLPMCSVQNTVPYQVFEWTEGGQ